MHGYTRWVIVKELVASVGHEGRDVLQHEGSVPATGVSHATHPPLPSATKRTVCACARSAGGQTWPSQGHTAHTFGTE